MKKEEKKEMNVNKKELKKMILQMKKQNNIQIKIQMMIIIIVKEKEEDLSIKKVPKDLD